VIEFALFVLANFKNDGVEPLAHPANGSMLFRQIGTVVLVVGMGEELQRFFEPTPASGSPAIAHSCADQSGAAPEKYNSYTSAPREGMAQVGVVKGSAEPQVSPFRTPRQNPFASIQ
jgi:hypothetical protein